VLDKARETKGEATEMMLNERAGDERLAELIDWALPIQQSHFEQVKAAPSSWPGGRIPAKRRRQEPMSTTGKERDARGT